MEQSLLSMYDLSGHTAIVTGASRGLGVSFARGLAKAGSNLVLAARSYDQVVEVSKELSKFGSKVIPVKADVTKIDDIKKMVSRTLREFNKIDILVNNAGIAAVASAEDMTSEEWQSVIDTNLTGLFYCAQQVGKQMLRQQKGKIINIASMYGISASSYLDQVSYISSKSAVLGLTRELAVEWGPKGVTVTAIAPGFFLSDQTAEAFKVNKELGNKLLAKVPMGRIGKPEELEGTIVYMASAASDYMNGQALILDGGFLAW